MFLKYLFSLLISVCICSIAGAQIKDIDIDSKISQQLKSRLSVAGNLDSIDIIIAVSQEDALYKQLEGKGRIISAYKPAGIIVIRSSKIKTGEILSARNVLFADTVKEPKEELTTGYLDLATNKINKAHTNYPQVKGNEIVVSVKEQQFDTSDIDFKGRTIATGVAASTQSAHAAIMATTIAGAGNTSPFSLGAAPAAKLASASFAYLLPDADSVYKKHSITIQNHSYGTVVETYYGAEAAAYDQSVWENPSLVHVFSAGNSGLAAPATGMYTGLEGFSNLTGNFKTSKNSIVIGATDSIYSISAASSRGPVEDGRIKPEIVAFGEDGSSGAAALVSGTAALIQQAYQINFNKVPTAALVKAVLINSAEDVGPKGPDYSSGYGSLNGYEALKTLFENRNYEGVSSQNELHTFQISVPQNLSKLKVTLVWSDTTGTINAKKALVNDLDLTVKHQLTNELWYPWVLSSVPQKDSLIKEAIRKVDTLNNVEQVSIEFPAAGEYSIEVVGSKVAHQQVFAIAFKLDTLQQFEWTFPTAKDNISAGKTNILRWQTSFTSPGSLLFTTNGTDWQEIASGLNPESGFYKWQAPDTLTTAQVKMQFSNAASVVSDTFTISKSLNLQVGFNCADSFLVFWKPLPASNYNIYNLGSQYLEKIAIVDDTFFLFKQGAHRSDFYSVAPVVNGKEGIRSFTLNYKTQGADCYFRSFYLQQQDERVATFNTLIGSLYNVASITFQKLKGQEFVNLSTIQAPISTTFLFADSSLTQGVNFYRVQLKLNDGREMYSNDVTIYHFPGAPVIIYPNPVRQGLSINIITNGAGRHTIEIYNVNGHLVEKMELKNLLNQVNSTKLPKGIYFIHIINDEGLRTTQKLIIY